MPFTMNAAPEPIKVRTISERLVEVVREMVLTGDIASDFPIRQDALASQLGVSKIPLREALVRLEHEGLVRYIVNRGYFVRPLTLSEAEEVYELRLKLEPDAVAEACLQATDAEREKAQRALADLESMVANDPTGRADNQHRDFHMALVDPCGKQMKKDIIARLHIVAGRYVLKHLDTPERHARADVEHQSILKCWLDRDAEGTKKLVQSHLEDTLADLRNEIASQEASDAEKEPAKRRSPRKRKTA
ncbi:MAG: GntR family transcriptional regulator [Kordiimonas sp.]